MTTTVTFKKKKKESQYTNAVACSGKCYKSQCCYNDKNEKICNHDISFAFVVDFTCRIFSCRILRLPETPTGNRVKDVAGGKTREQRKEGCNGNRDR